MRLPISRAAFVAALAGLLGLPGCALTQSGVVWRMDPIHHTVTIDQSTYQLTSETSFYGATGNPIVVGQLPTAEHPHIGLRAPERAAVDFRAHRESGTLYLDSLWMRRR